MEQTNNNKKKLLSIVGFAILLMGLIGISYSMFNYTRTGVANRISVGSINFDAGQNIVTLTNFVPISSRDALTDTDNVGIINIHITGDTEYDRGIEYLVTAKNVSNTIGNKVIPISILVTYEESTGKDIGSPDENYFINRGGNSSLYKVLPYGNLSEDTRIVVGYIKQGTTGIDGNLTIRAYVDDDDIIVSDTYTGTTDKIVLTTAEWNQLKGDNALSFQVKVEANDGVWVTNQSNGRAITFLSEGGSSVSGIEVAQGDMIGEFPSKPARSGYAFKGWYTAASGGEEITESTVVTADMTLHAQWDKLICLKAPDGTRHTETCSSGGTCLSATDENNVTYTNGSTIYYGIIPGNRSPSVGYAYDCDVDNDNDYVELDTNNQPTYTERFYYLRNNSGTNNSSLVYHSSIDENGIIGSSGDLKAYVYASTTPIIPDANKWSNPGLITIDSKKSRLLNTADIEAACGSPISYGTTGYTDSCQFLLEATRFQSSSMARNGIWLEMEDGKYRRITSSARNVVNNLKSDSTNTVRPVIEIPSRLIEGYVETYHVTFNSQGGTSVAGRDIEDGSTLGTLPNEPRKAGYIFAGWYTTPSYTKAVTSATVIESNRTVYAKWEEDPNYVPSSIVTLNAGDGSLSSTEIPVNIGSMVGELPNPTPPTGYVFDAWYNQDYTVMYTSETVVNSDMTFYAKYATNDNIAAVGPTYYTKLQTAINDIANGTVSSNEIRILQDYTVTSDDNSGRPTVPSGATVIINGQGHILTCYKNNVIYNLGTTRITSGTITCGYSTKGPIENTNGGSLYVEGGTISNTNDRGAIYNNGGHVYVSGGTVTSSAEDRGTIQNVNSTSSITITGGTVLQSNSNCTKGAIDNIANGTLVIGTQNNAHDKTTPVIQGAKYGVNSGKNFAMYDGIIKGGTNAITGAGTITEYEEGAVQHTEIVEGYQELYYTIPEEYILNLVTYGGSVSPISETIEVGNTLSASSLPTPSWTNKTFGGWYLDDEFTEPVPNTIAPLTSGSGNIYAKWTYTPASSLVNYDTTNNAMNTYYSNISTWKDLSESDFNTQMTANFNNNNCSACEGANSCNSPGAGTYCDKPKVYDTGASSAVNVYLYDETTHVIGKKVEYALSSSGTLSNLIPGQAYYWEKTSDPSVNGHVQVTTPRRNIDAGNVRNVRDLGGMSVSYTENNVQKTGTIKYGKLYRGAKLSSSNDDITSLTNLGITREIDLRADSEGSGQVRLPVLDNGSGGSDIVITNYLINPTATTYISSAHLSDYRNLKAAMKTVMRYIVNGDSIYFHCTIGTDRTGTIAYFLEGLLGVSEEDRLEDYELTYFFGLTNRTRYHDYLSGSSINPRFYSMYRSYPDYQAIYNFYKYEPESDDDTLLAAFRSAMIDFNS